MRIRCAVAVTMTCAGVAAMPAAAAAQSSPEELAAAVARPAVVLVSANWHGWVRDRRTGEVFGGSTGYDVTVTCTGVVISPDGYVATASHCVHTGPLGGAGALFDAAIADLTKTGRIGDPARAKEVLAEHAVAEGAVPDSVVDRALQVERMAGGDEPARDIAPATVVDLVDPTDGDIAVIKIPRERLPAVEIRLDTPPVGTPVLAIGYPHSAGSPVDPNLEPSNKPGQISAHRTEGERPFYENSADTTPGMAGGPLVDHQGRLVGLIGRDLASAAPILTNLIQAKGITPSQSPADRNFRTGLDHYFAGDLDTAIDYFDAVLDDSPTHRQAATYRRLAIDQGGSPGTSPTLLILAICAAVVAIATAALAATLLARRRRLTTTPTPPYGISLPAEIPIGLRLPPITPPHGTPTQPAAPETPAPTATPAGAAPPPGATEGPTDKLTRRELTADAPTEKSTAPTETSGSAPTSEPTATSTPATEVTAQSTAASEPAAQPRAHAPAGGSGPPAHPHAEAPTDKLRADASPASDSAADDAATITPIPAADLAGPRESPVTPKETALHPTAAPARGAPDKP